jgi:hypothetical protein
VKLFVFIVCMRRNSLALLSSLFDTLVQSGLWFDSNNGEWATLFPQWVVSMTLVEKLAPPFIEFRVLFPISPFSIIYKIIFFDCCSQQQPSAARDSELPGSLEFALANRIISNLDANVGTMAKVYESRGELD